MNSPMKSCLLMLIILIVITGFTGTAAVLYFSSSEVEVSSTSEG